MYEQMLKDLLKTKLKIVNSVISILPPEIKEQAANFQKNVFKAVNEVTKEYVSDTTPCKSEKELKSINID